MKSYTYRLLKDFCDTTSLHGYNHLYSSDSKAVRITWVIIILIATVCGSMFIVRNTKAYLSATIVTNIESSTVPLDVSNTHSLIHEASNKQLYF